MSCENNSSNVQLNTLEETLTLYPPIEKTFEVDVEGGVDLISALVSNDAAGQILYVVPRSSIYIHRTSMPVEGAD